MKKNDNLQHYFFQVGDEIYQVNGYKVSDAVHRELTKYIASQDRITLRVRGMSNECHSLFHVLVGFFDQKHAS